MFAGQWEGCPLVVKGLPVAVQAIMAGAAVRSEGRGMAVHKLGLDLLVATGAHVWVKTHIGRWVAAAAPEGAAICHFLVRQQREPQLVVREVADIIFCERSRGPAVLGMAGVAAGELALGHHQRVEIFGILTQVGVAGEAGAGHAAAAEGRRVALLAARNFGMAGHPAQRGRPGLGAQRARAE